MTLFWWEECRYDGYRLMTTTPGPSPKLARVRHTQIKRILAQQLSLD
jgi:hypothetical protein